MPCHPAASKRAHLPAASKRAFAVGVIHGASLLGSEKGWRSGSASSFEGWQAHRLHAAGGSARDKAKLLRGLADEGDALALELFDDQALALGITLLNVNYLGDYDLLVIGGGVCDLSPATRERYRRGVIESYRRHALEGFQNMVDVAFSVCGDSAPAIGALQWASARSGNPQRLAQR